MSKPCDCGSELDSYELYDARGIYVARVCEKCVDQVKSRFRSGVFRESDHWLDEEFEE